MLTKYNVSFITDPMAIRFWSKCSILKLYFHYHSQVISETIFRKQIIKRYLR